MNSLLNRKSIRNFKEENVKEEDLKVILEATMRYPNYANAQLVSAIVIKDKNKIKELAKLSGGQKQVETSNIVVVFVIDYNRVKHIFDLNNKELNILNDVESVLVGAGDVGIMISQFQAAAHKLNYGTTVIGGIRLNPDKVSQLLNLPKHTYPLLASTLGVPEDFTKNLPLKPRIDTEGTIFFEEYNDELAKESVIKYDNQLKNYFDSLNLNLASYNESVFSYLGNTNSNTKDNLLKQGFNFLK